MCEQGSHFSRIENVQGRFDGLQGDAYFLALFASETGDFQELTAEAAGQAQLIMDGRPQELPNGFEDPHAEILATLGAFARHYYSRYYDRGKDNPHPHRPVA